MKTTRLGCISSTGIITTLLAVLLIGGIAYARGGVLFNPGELNAQAGGRSVGGVASHAETGGRCSACHVPFWEVGGMDDRCLVCHVEIEQSADDFHRVMLAQSQSHQCYNCHTEHRGAQASLTVLDLQRFPHQAVGYSLQAHVTSGAGAAFTCFDCHGGTFGSFNQANCTACHHQINPAFMDAHLADFGDGCLACHDGIDTYGKIFDHNSLAFPLQGEHANAACSGCHAGAVSLAELRQAPHECSACHLEDDAHAGNFGQDCGTCHTPDGWEGAAFDHSLAAFPLTGAHATAACEDCHQGGVFQGTPQDCFSCHAADDAHDGRFGQDCAACHTPDGWEGAVFDHTLAAFQLTGAHATVACEDCHQGGVFQGIPQDCAACHAEPDYHAGQFGIDCAACHDTAAWMPALFDRPHTFPFDHGENGRSECRVCHPDSVASYTCYTCHEHSPADIEQEHREEGISNFSDCTRCHPTGQEEEGGDGGGDGD